MHVPGRGLFHGSTSANGDIVLSEDRLRSLIATSRGYETLAHAMEKALGRPLGRRAGAVPARRPTASP